MRSIAMLAGVLCLLQSSAPVGAESASISSPKLKSSSDFQFYAVRTGDTIESISDHFESNPKELCRMNTTIGRGATLVPGSILMVPQPPPPVYVHVSSHSSGVPVGERTFAPQGPSVSARPGGNHGGLSRDEAEVLYETIVQPVAKGIIMPAIAYSGAGPSLSLPTSQNLFVSSSGQRMYIPAAAPKRKPEIEQVEPLTHHALSSPRALRTQNLLKSALHFMGVPYVWGGESPSGFDCSGFIQRVFSLNGVSVPRTADLQFEVGERVRNGEEQPGDVVFFETYCPGASHVGIYLGRHQFVHASSTAGHITIGDLRSQRFQRCYLGAKRIL